MQSQGYTTVDAAVNLWGLGVNYRLRMGKKPSLADRLETIMEAMGWKPADLGRAAGVTRQAVWNWLNRPNPILEFQYALNLQTKTKYNARWIIYGEGPERIEPLTQDEEAILKLYREASPAKRGAVTTLLES